MNNTVNKVLLILLTGVGVTALLSIVLVLSAPNTDDIPAISYTPKPKNDIPVVDYAEGTTPYPANPPTPTPVTSPTPTPPVIPVAEKFNLKVPFTAQAPTANWDEIHNEACEEASSIMAFAYFAGVTVDKLDPAWVEKEIEKLTQWQKDEHGYYLDSDTAETAKMIRENYGLKTDIVPYSEDTIKRALNSGKLVIMPVDGKLLNNPNFRNGGPPYHMIVIRGYDDKYFYTNDPGTRKGNNYKYTYETLADASGEWDHDSHTVDTGNKQIIIVYK